MSGVSLSIRDNAAIVGWRTLIDLIPCAQLTMTGRLYVVNITFENTDKRSRSMSNICSPAFVSYLYFMENRLLF